MQNAPIVQLPAEKPHRDWPLIVATLVVIAIAVLVVVMLANPGLLLPSTEVTANDYINPEIGTFERFLAQRAAGPDNPELSAFNRYLEMHSAGPTLHPNPEIEQFWRWLEAR